ncbi:hypothetical protein AB9K26_05475 [Psychroserpens sp. XS_ASV72]|uniref:hypothetical protein n=1 Tax=Psychroserpens sp. XS_ASV72 TaxID=3241293 RepID=UPI003513B4F6
MNKKWYISALVVVLAFLGGIITQEQISKPNQEIVLQFTSNTVTTDEADTAISSITEQLHAVGVTNIQVTEYHKGQLKIVYHSNADISSIKDILSKEKSIGNDTELPLELPSEHYKVAYNLDVYELQDVHDGELKFQGALGFDHKGSQELIHSPNPYANVNIYNYSVAQLQNYDVAEHYKYVAISHNHIAYKIPEVRAGPTS